jgi:hypothetical protein
MKSNGNTCQMGVNVPTSQLLLAYYQRFLIKQELMTFQAVISRQPMFVTCLESE